MKLEDILQDPAEVYKKPQDVLADSDLTDAEKCKVLAQWKYDAEELQTATSENMPGPDDSLLDDILAVRKKLNCKD
ncbi:hypothetical protein [Pseudidiomarina homiensis]|uniref:Uncharacterized protein n=1 Tax=Pseudidiomarina homiensis TaxID=364198 RepID=A0A432Y3I5_9GAMM|nr:hypothetical protein [Pseudidiomarina homiensis]RUO55530.1 hypothetical protein CWI70_01730 [Pseudidiomarina homiensis]